MQGILKFILKHLSYFRLILQHSKKHSNQAISNICFSVEQEISKWCRKFTLTDDDPSSKQTL
jgi:hypothetical protein